MVSEQMARPKRFTLLGVLMTSLAILTLEIVFTRVFSVLMWYHFAFMVISLALIYLVLALPFFMGGGVFALAISRYSLTVVAWTPPWRFGLRVPVLAALIYPAGFLMGQPFPRGLKLQCMQPAGD
jgi:hypothetical protein